jgi:hypothetical protein
MVPSPTERAFVRASPGARTGVGTYINYLLAASIVAASAAALSLSRARAPGPAPEPPDPASRRREPPAPEPPHEDR